MKIMCNKRMETTLRLILSPLHSYTLLRSLIPYALPLCARFLSSTHIIRRHIQYIGSYSFQIQIFNFRVFRTFDSVTNIFGSNFLFSCDLCTLLVVFHSSVTATKSHWYYIHAYLNMNNYCGHNSLLAPCHFTWNCKQKIKPKCVQNHQHILQVLYSYVSNIFVISLFSSILFY